MTTPDSADGNITDKDLKKHGIPPCPFREGDDKTIGEMMERAGIRLPVIDDPADVAKVLFGAPPPDDTQSPNDRPQKHS